MSTRLAFDPARNGGWWVRLANGRAGKRLGRVGRWAKGWGVACPRQCPELKTVAEASRAKAAQHLVGHECLA